MVKSHNIKLTITNHSGFAMKFDSDWFDSGQLANDYSWPDEIRDGDHQTILLYERDNSWAGCSGYVNYTMGSRTVTIGFSNPAAGKNKLDVGTSGKGVWDDMGNHNYDPFVVKITIDGVTLNFNCQCTGSTTNVATVSIFKE